MEQEVGKVQERSSRRMRERRRGRGADGRRRCRRVAGGRRTIEK